MTPRLTLPRTFNRALVLSAAAHAVLFILIALSPRLGGGARREFIQYIPLNLGGWPGGGGGGGGASGAGPALPSSREIKKESLRDLTTIQKMQEMTRSDLRYPVDKPKRDKKAGQEKKTAISAPRPDAKERSGASASGSGTAGEGGPGSGVRIGLGGPGTGSGTGYSSQIGLSGFPYTYYLQIITDRVSANWFTSLVDPGVRGEFEAVVYFQIYRTGQISEVKVEQSSGLRSLDLSAMRAVQRSAPFPPLPRDYAQDHLGIYLIFEHAK